VVESSGANVPRIFATTALAVLLAGLGSCSARSASWEEKSLTERLEFCESAPAIAAMRELYPDVTRRAASRCQEAARAGANYWGVKGEVSAEISDLMRRQYLLASDEVIGRELMLLLTTMGVVIGKDRSHCWEVLIGGGPITYEPAFVHPAEHFYELQAQADEVLRSTAANPIPFTATAEDRQEVENIYREAEAGLAPRLKAALADVLESDAPFPPKVVESEAVCTMGFAVTIELTRRPPAEAARLFKTLIESPHAWTVGQAPSRSNPHLKDVRPDLGAKDKRRT
jgi:hypothetical protein